jgi:hypothetical protein
MRKTNQFNKDVPAQLASLSSHSDFASITIKRLAFSLLTVESSETERPRFAFWQGRGACLGSWIDATSTEKE